MKAILVIDMPKDCWNCPLHRNSWDEDNEEIMICRGTYKESHYGEKPEWCPLKPMPQKMKADYDTIATCEVTEKVVAIGWNACINTILGEEDETSRTEI